MRALSRVEKTRLNASSEEQREFVAFIASRADRADALKQDDLDRRKRIWLALIVSLIVHGLLYLGIRQWSLLHRVDSADFSVLHLRLIDTPSTAPPPAVVHASSPQVQSVLENAQKPELVESRVAPAVAPPAAVPAEPIIPARVPHAASATKASADALAAIFDHHGRVVLPDAVADDPAIFGSRKHALEYTENPMAHQSPLAYKSTSFDRYWTPDGETLLGEWVRKASKTSSHDTKHGTRITCGAFLFLISCGWGPTPRVSIEELKAMRAEPPAPRHSADDPYVQPEN